MANWRYDVNMTDRARIDYLQLQMVAETYVALRPLPSNTDPHRKRELTVLEYYDRARKLLSSLREPLTANLDCSLLGQLSFMKYQTESDTTVYFTRSKAFWNVTVIHISETPLDYNALLKVVFSGNAHELPRLGIPTPPIEGFTWRGLTIH